MQVVQEFADTDSYAEYNEQDLFYGTRVEALARGDSRVNLGTGKRRRTVHRRRLQKLDKASG